MRGLGVSGEASGSRVARPKFMFSGSELRVMGVWGFEV
jgi:hypothetical protein